jgi:hypothetical protein
MAKNYPPFPKHGSAAWAKVRSTDYAARLGSITMDPRPLLTLNTLDVGRHAADGTTSLWVKAYC